MCQDETVRNCVSLLAAAVGQPEELLEKWLELYYRVRCACERDSVTLTVRPVPEPEKKTDSPAAAPEPEKPSSKTSHPGNHHAADAAAYKRAVRERYLEARRAGLTTGKILETANGAITDGNLLDIGEARVVSVNVYRVLAAVLDKIQET